ncbi:MAG: hypothetical protein FJW30_17020 [Acidobacteria bacterium]|nr:hypothetical protein [Acidobacteriota bacterium]
MDIVGTRKFVEIGGDQTHELPPLLIADGPPPARRLEKVMNMAAELVETDALIPFGTVEDAELDRRRYDLAVQFSEQYLGLRAQWRWGDAVLEWIRQCETTFEMSAALRGLLRPDVWPHAGRTSFVALLQDKHVDFGDVQLNQALGLRLAFRHLPPLACCTDQFLMYLHQSVAASAYQAWASMTPDPVSALPPERFAFQVVRM